jgi:UDP-N-acetylmuramate--alanine ligase
VTAEALAARMREFGQRDVAYARSNEAGVKEIALGATPGDLIVTLGAGSVSQLGERILEELTANAKAA